ncbi:MAG: hypothetical protein A2Y33_16020 [Spirochaetes bacterium GWF1_51_8]|nr:MAG: hypothetical protein A2Y33_16020 [Spirochaetes bacterium GWF1_51_8]
MGAIEGLLKAFILVGHSDWGKSETLYSLTDNSRHSYYYLEDHCFITQRMSNDDESEWYSLYNSLERKIKKNWNSNPLLFALCPNFSEGAKNTINILELLKQNKYKMYFFVLQKKYTNNFRKDSLLVSPQEVQILMEYGEVEVFSEMKESFERAKAFESFIKKKIYE